MDHSGLDVHGPRDAAGRPGRLGRTERRETLLDVAAALVGSGSPEAVTMEAVAERAGVSRPLVYKHFHNRSELLSAVYRREAAHVHDLLTAEVAAAASIHDMFRALVRGALRAAAEQGDLFAALRASGAWSPEVRREQRARDRRTSRAFAARAEKELGIEPEAATAGTAMLLSLIDPVLSQWRLDPTAHQARLLETTFMTIVTASLTALASGGDGVLPSRPPGPSAGADDDLD
ncbi:MAG TPA: TetR/AcrR family transcriptional regulator [Acidimicrobiales bacterium]|nr:TetR/AcrR family transcriptional regulator [Acidimicrobiales bacterium]